MVGDKVVCQRPKAEAEEEEEEAAEEAGYRIKNKNPTQRCGEISACAGQKRSPKISDRLNLLVKNLWVQGWSRWRPQRLHHQRDMMKCSS